MPLLDSVQDAVKRLKKADSARAGVDEAQALDELRKVLSERHELLERAVTQKQLLKQNKVTVSIPPDLKKQSAVLDGAAAQFRASPIAKTLKTGRRWTGLLDMLTALRGEIGDLQLRDWQTYFRTKLFAGAAPETVKARLAMTPENMKAVTRYTELYATFSAYRSKIPESQAEFDRLRHCSDAMAKISFDENVPADVAKFFAATASNIGAGLELLTSDALQWLRQNGLLSKYVVRARLE